MARYNCARASPSRHSSALRCHSSTGFWTDDAPLVECRRRHRLVRPFYESPKNRTGWRTLRSSTTAESAELRNDRRRLAELRPVLAEACIERDRATEAYRQHIRSHSEAASAKLPQGAPGSVSVKPWSVRKWIAMRKRLGVILNQVHKIRTVAFNGHIEVIWASPILLQELHVSPRRRHAGIGQPYRPAPWADAMRKDQTVRPPIPTRMPTRCGCRCRISRDRPRRP
jgi:hypothetical protein